MSLFSFLAFSTRIDIGFSLGKSGLKVSKIILGAMSYGSPDWQDWVLDEEKSLPLLEHAYKVGYVKNMLPRSKSQKNVTKSYDKT